MKWPGIAASFVGGIVGGMAAHRFDPTGLIGFLAVVGVLVCGLVVGVAIGLGKGER